MATSTGIRSFIAGLTILTGTVLYAEPNDRHPEQGNMIGISLELTRCTEVLCFDQEFWRIIGNVADIETILPSEMDSFEVEIRPNSYLPDSLRIVFTREALLKLVHGELRPHRFLQDHVTFL